MSKSLDCCDSENLGQGYVSVNKREGIVDWKENAQHESCELNFIQGLTEDCSPGDSLSDSSEVMFRRGG